MSASIRVFGVPELLEMILDHMAMEDVLLQQRVSVGWHEIFRGSSHLQEKFFFKARELSFEDRQTLRIEWNPLLAQMFTSRRPWLSSHRGVIQDSVLRSQIENLLNAHQAEASWRRICMTSCHASILCKFTTDLGIIKIRIWKASEATMGAFFDFLWRQWSGRVQTGRYIIELWYERAAGLYGGREKIVLSN